MVARNRNTASDHAHGERGVREYVENMPREAPTEPEDLELAAQCARDARDDEAELHFRLRAFSVAPSFGALRRLADALSRSEHLEMAAEAWRYIARACPLDAGARAEAQTAQTRLSSRVPACGIEPHNQGEADGRVSGVYRSHDAPAQGTDPKSRKHL